MGTTTSALGGYGSLISALSPIFLGSGQTTQNTTSSPQAIAAIIQSISGANSNINNPSATNAIVNNIATTNAEAFLPTAVAQNSSGLYNSSTLSLLSSEAQARSTAQASQAVLNYQTSQQQIAQQGATALGNLTKTTTQQTAPSVPGSSLLQLGGGLAASFIANKALNSAFVTNNVTDPISNALGFGSSPLGNIEVTDPGELANAAPGELGAGNTIIPPIPPNLDVAGGTAASSATDTSVAGATSGTTDAVGAGTGTSATVDATGTTLPSVGADISSPGAISGLDVSGSNVAVPAITPTVAPSVFDSSGVVAGSVADTGATTGVTGITDAAATGSASLDTAGAAVAGTVADSAVGAGADVAGATVAGAAGADVAGATAAGDLGAASAGDLAAATAGTEVAGDAGVAAGTGAALAGGADAGADIGAGIAVDSLGDATLGAGAADVGAAAAGASGIGDLLTAAASVLAWVVCTELVIQGKMDKRLYIYGKKRFDNYWCWGKQGYLLWGIPLAKYVRKHPDSLGTKAISWIFNKRVNNIAWEDGYKKAKWTWSGKIIYELTYFISWCLGKYLEFTDKNINLSPDMLQQHNRNLLLIKKGIN
jgi:hypothetical protein